MKIEAADLFCGAGGTSTGLQMACDEMGYTLNLLAVNHWDTAIATHSSNHPDSKHLCESLDNVNPRHAVPGGRLNLLVASPECTHHSIARGGKPINEQSRASAWHVLRWAEAITVDNILIENVREFRNWGPCGVNGRPLQRQKGATYLAFLNALRSLGYSVEDRILNAADYGDPTTRERLFIMARRGRRTINWPVPSHQRDMTGMFTDGAKKWRAAREIIDWNLEGQSIFDRKRPLAPKTMERIIAGLKKFGGKDAEPFIVVLRNHMAGRSADQPLPTITGGGNHMGVAVPFIVPNFGEREGQEPRSHSVDEPLPTVTGHGAGALCQALLLPQQSGGQLRPVDRPVPTVACDGAIGLVEPILIPQFSSQGARSVDRPVNTLTTTSRGIGLAQFVVSAGGPTGRGRNPRSLDDPMDTVMTENHDALVQSFMVTVNHGDEGAASAGGRAKDRFGLVEFEGQLHRLDVRFRMLQPHELSQAQGFPKDYQFKGNRESVVKQIGNAVPVNLAKALCRELIGPTR
jgi:DNA (cytosine-5)-methyltransferase 1